MSCKFCLKEYWECIHKKMERYRPEYDGDEYYDVYDSFSIPAEDFYCAYYEQKEER